MRVYRTRAFEGLLSTRATYHRNPQSVTSRLRLLSSCLSVELVCELVCVVRRRRCACIVRRAGFGLAGVTRRITKGNENEREDEGWNEEKMQRSKEWRNKYSIGIDSPRRSRNTLPDADPRTSSVRDLWSRTLGVSIRTILGFLFRSKDGYRSLDVCRVSQLMGIRLSGGRR